MLCWRCCGGRCGRCCGRRHAWTTCGRTFIMLVTGGVAYGYWRDSNGWGDGGVAAIQYAVSSGSTWRGLPVKLVLHAFATVDAEAHTRAERRASRTDAARARRAASHRLTSSSVLHLRATSALDGGLHTPATAASLQPARSVLAGALPPFLRACFSLPSAV